MQTSSKHYSRIGSRGRSAHNHSVQFYESETYLYAAVSQFLSAGLRAGNPIVVIATPEHRNAFQEQLQLEGLNLHGALQSGQFINLDARETLGTFMDQEFPNRDRFLETVGGVIEKARAERQDRTLLAYGEMVDVLWREGKREAAIRLEELWNDLVATHAFELFCAYTMNGFNKEAHHPHFEHICEVHSKVLPTEHYLELDEEDRLREISRLQQRSLALETELQHRREAEEALLRALDETRDNEEKLANTKRAAETLESFLTAIVESADDAIVSKTLEGIITSWNPGAEKLFGYSAAETIGKSISILIPPDHPNEEPNILGRLVRGERIDHYETKRIRKDGKIIDISLTVSPVKNRRGEIIGASKIARDISDRKRIEAERDELLIREQEARSQAEAANRLKDEFLAMLSHELRTPLNAILGWTDVLNSPKGQGMASHAVEVIQRNARVQKRLIEDLLDMSRILTGKMVIKRETVDLAAVLSAALDSVRSAATAKQITVDLAIDESVRVVTGDSDRLQQVVWNLLANAIKFTPLNGRVELRLQNCGTHAEIVVRDTGDGISPDFLPHVFERFRQGDGSTSRQHGGLGLGLAVVRHLVEAHGGRVWADSGGAGQGSTFVVSLPIVNTDSHFQV
jgi:PAS domain S-box-containing protein